MSQGAGSEESGYPPAFDRTIGESQTWLVDRGRTIVGTGSFRSGTISGSLHTDFGPDYQDKDVNQDYALLWLPEEGAMRRRFRLVVAMADGLTTSFRSEWASALACSLAVRALAESDGSLSPEEQARRAADCCAAALKQQADELAENPEASCPVGQFVSTWKYILRKGSLFQSTLTLAWLDEQHFRVAMIGDGGALWRAYRAGDGSSSVEDRVLAQCVLDQHQVRALGPIESRAPAFDYWHEERLEGPFVCALHTDGIGRGLAGQAALLLDRVEEFRAAGEENPARRFIEQVVEERPEEFEDNLSLAVIRCEG